MAKKYSDESVQKKFKEFRSYLSAFGKQNHLDVPSKEIDDFQNKVFSEMRQTKYKNAYLPWTNDDDLRLTQMSKLEIPIGKIALELGRTELAISRRIENLKFETVLKDLPQFFGTLSEKLGVKKEDFIEKVNDILFVEQFKSLREKISKRFYNDEEVEFDFTLENKRPQGRPRKDEKVGEFLEITMTATKKPRKQKTMSQFWAELGNSQTRLEQ